jgi:hypothetical protein
VGCESLGRLFFEEKRCQEISGLQIDGSKSRIIDISFSARLPVPE